MHATLRLIADANLKFESAAEGDAWGQAADCRFWFLLLDKPNARSSHTGQAGGGQFSLFDLPHSLKEATQASNRWLGERLHMGRPEAVSV